MKAVAAVAALAGAASASPFKFPLPNGFPTPDMAAIAAAEQQAGGTLPNTALPTSISKDLQTSFQLIAANEIFEVAFFTELYNNITEFVPGYECTEMNRDFVKDAVYRIRAQEENHALGANAVVNSTGGEMVGACQYQFPVSDFDSAIALANTFTDVVLGVLPAVQYQSATDGGAEGAALIPLVGSIEEQEAEQVGWFRILQSKFPSAAPFLTPTTPQFALSAIKLFIVPGTCPSIYNEIEAAIASFPPLMVTQMPTPAVQSAKYAITGTLPAGAAVAYISGQNKPVTVTPTNIATSNGMTTFDAPFPADQGFADGLTVAAVVNANKQYATPADVAMNTMYGPGLIEYL